MGLLQTLRKFSFSLSEQQRNVIWKAFGSFTANQFALNSSNNIINNSYERNTDVYAVIHRIVEVIKSHEWVVEEKQRDGSWLELKDTTLHEVLVQPNKTKGYTWNDIEEMLLVYLLCSGNAYLYGERAITRSLIQEVDVLPSEYVCIENYGNNFFMPDIKYYFNLGTYKEIPKDQLSHIRYFNPAYNSIKESLYGLSPIRVAASAVQGGNDTWDAMNSLYQNRGASGLITDKSNRPMLPDEAAKVQSDFNNQISGVSNFGKIKVTNKDLSYIQMGMSAEELKLIEAGVISLRAICNVFNVSSILFNDPNNKTYNNMKEAEKAFYTDAIMPLSNKLAEKFNQFFIPNHFGTRNVRMRQDYSQVEVLQADKKQEAEKDKIVMDGINVILNMPVSAEVKAILIKENYEVSDDVVSTYLSNTQSSNKQLNILSSVSPLLGTQLLQQLNSSEIRNILELQGDKEIIIPQSNEEAI
jgi:HK97 family phage portal protein